MPFTLNPNDVELVLGAIKQLADAKINARALAEYLYKKRSPEEVTKSNVDSARSRWNGFLARLEKAEKEGTGEEGENGGVKDGEKEGGKGKAKPNTPKKRKMSGEGDGDDLAAEDGVESKPTTPKKRKRGGAGDDLAGAGEVTGSGKKTRKTGGKGRKAAAVKEEVMDAGEEADVEETTEAWDA